MQPSFAIIAAGCILLAVAAQAQTSTDALPSPSQMGEPAQPGEPGQATITPPPMNDQPGNASAKGSNLSDMTITRDGTEVRETPDGGSRLAGSMSESKCWPSAPRADGRISSSAEPMDSSAPRR